MNYEMEKLVPNKMGKSILNKIMKNNPDQAEKTGFNKTEAQHRNLRFLLYLLPVAVGTLFCLWYIHSAACDVIYSDYIRLVDSYLPDVTDPKKFFVPDILTRIPAAFLSRIVNVGLFAYSVTFDRLCGVAGLFLCGAVIARYAARHRIGGCIYLLMMLVLFSLIKWEILLNGSAWAHVVSFGLFFLNYEILDRVFEETEMPPGLTLGSKGKHARHIALCVLPFVILLFAGEYIAAYTGGMILAYIYCMLRERNGSTGTKENWRVYLICSVLPLILYLISRHYAVWEHAGATDLSFSEAMREEPLFLPRFFIKTFAGAVLGQESINSLLERQIFSDKMVLLLGVLVIAAYLFAIFLYLHAKLYRKTIFPMILLLTGGMNHVLVTLSRWIFLKESYALSSRYAGQFMIGILGILLIFGLWLREVRKACHAGLLLRKGILSLFCVLFLAGNWYTTEEEIHKAPYREQNYEALSVMLRNYHDYSEEELRKGLEWNKDAQTMYHALSVLEENHLNVFRNAGRD